MTQNQGYYGVPRTQQPNNPTVPLGMVVTFLVSHWGSRIFRQKKRIGQLGLRWFPEKRTAGRTISAFAPGNLSSGGLRYFETMGC